jgi:hypothetical protein
MTFAAVLITGASIKSTCRLRGPKWSLCRVPHLAIPAEHCGFARDHLSTLRNDARFGANAARIPRYGPSKIAFGLDRGVARAFRQEGVPGAASDAVDQSQRPATVHTAHRVEQMLPRLTLKSGEAVADLRDPEGDGLKDRRLRQLVVNDCLQDLPARLTGDSAGVGKP